MSVNLEKNDLNINLHLGLVCQGRMGDLTKLRETIRETTGVNVVFNTLSSEYLFIVKKSNLSIEQKQLFEKKGAAE